MNDTKIKIKSDVKPILSKNVAKLSAELEKSPLTVANWIYNRPQMFKKRYIKRAVKKITGLSEAQIFETQEQ